MVRREDTTGLLLAGGRSRRMGNDKALLSLEGKPFVAHVADCLRAVFEEVLLSANSGAYDFTGLPRVADRIIGAGPLEGIRAAMERTAQEHLFVLPCDTPLVAPDMVRTILAQAEPGIISVAEGGSGLQPLVGVYPRTLLPELTGWLGEGGRKVMDFLERSGYRRIVLPGDDMRLRNINTPDEFGGPPA